jgi:hypothetical protein
VTRPGWRLVAGERSVRFSPVWFRLVDDHTGQPPVELVQVRLDRREGTEWKPTDLRATVTLAGMIGVPGLERRREVTGVQPRRYRVRVEAERYRPLYRALTSGLGFDVLPHNDDVQPPGPTRRDLVLLPSVTYPFAAHVRPLRGVVVDQAGTPVEDVLVRTQTQVGTVIKLERTLTDERGAFALALRWVASGATASVTAIDRRTQRTATVTVTVPDDLGHSQRIIIA